MTKILIRSVLCIVGLLAFLLQVALGQSSTARIVSATNAFLATLTDQQRKAVMYSFDDEEQRARWSNFPISMVTRGGINLRDMTPAQRSATMAVLSAALSVRGLEKVQQIMQGDEVLKTEEGNGPGGGKGKGGPPAGKGKDGKGKGGDGGLMFGGDLYYISILGTPSDKSPWMLQFGGHHLAVNITIDGERGVLTPTLTGAQPARYTMDGKTIRPLGQESDKALALLNALDENQRKQVVLNYRVADLVLGPGQDGKTIQPEGLKASAMNDRQRTMLLDVIGEWARIVHENAATARMAQLRAEINETWFAWSGPADTTPGNNLLAYYRIQGPHVVIEYAPQGMGGDPSNHVHTMYRDPTNDYGRSPAAK